MPAQNNPSKPELITPHGGYRKLKSYQNAEIIYDATMVFCNRFIDHHSRPRARKNQIKMFDIGCNKFKMTLFIFNNYASSGVLRLSVLNRSA